MEREPEIPRARGALPGRPPSRSRHSPVRPRAARLGVGGGGVNAVNRMVEAGITGVEFLAINTDVQSLHGSTADRTLHIGDAITRGLGSGSDPEVGRSAANDDIDHIKTCSRARTWCSWPRARAVAPGRAPRPSWPAWPATWAR